MMTLIRFLHLLSLVIWMGGIMFFSFIAAPSIFKVLPRETAGDVVGDIFPKYWLMGYVCSATALTTVMILSYWEQTYPWIRIALFVVMTGITFYSGLVIGANARYVKAQIRTTEDQTQKEILKVEFKRLHLRSSVLNSITLILGLIVLFITARSLRI